MNHHKTFVIIAGIMLLLGVFSGWPYVYYQILRWVITIVGAVNAYQSYKEKRTGWMWVMIAITILFNPIAPIYLNKGLWTILDIVVAVFMLSYTNNKHEK